MPDAGPDGQGLAIQLNRAPIGLFDSGQYLYQGGFAGPIFAKQGVNFTDIEGEIYMIKGLHTGERFADVCHRQDRRNVSHACVAFVP